MRRTCFTALSGAFVVAGAFLLLSPGLSGQEKEKGKKSEGAKAEVKLTPEQQAEQEAWMKASMPGPEHKQLDYMIGTWAVEARFWMPPSEEPIESKGTSTARWVLGDRFVNYQYTGEFMGMPFEGNGYTGYDNIQKKYISLWMDTMATGWMTETGTYDAGKKTFHFTSELTDPMGKKIKGRSTIQIRGPDEHLITAWHTREGEKEAKVMELIYRRAPGKDTPGKK